MFHLYPHKGKIERELFVRLRDLFSLQVDLVFYDLTSTYFEGQGPPELGAHGHSRDGKPRNRQVLVGCVMVEGWPIAHHVFAGNWRDSTTVPAVLKDIRERFGLRRVVFVGDRGMVTTDNLKLVRQKIGAAAARILSRHHGHRYYDWEFKDGAFRFFEQPVFLPREKAYEGKYIIRTEERNLSALDAVRIYKELSEVEGAFRNLKDVIDMRPIYHQTDQRVQAHIFVAALAFLLHRALEKKLKAAGLDLSATEALDALRTVRVVDIELGDESVKRSVTRGSARAGRILSAIGIDHRHPPAPANAQKPSRSDNPRIRP